MAKTPAATGPSLAQMNEMQRQIVLANAIDQTQRIFAQRFTPATGPGAPGNVLNIPLKNVGLVKMITVIVKARIRQTGTETLNRTPFGPANFFSQIVLTDLQNNVRHNASGWLLHYLATARNQAAFGAAFTNDSPTSLGANYQVVSAPQTITTVQEISMVYEIPVCYSDNDLRGAIYANVLNATWNLALTVNPQMFVAAGANQTLAVYRSSTAVLGTLESFDIEVYQHYLEQLPVDTNTGQVIYPLLDVSTMYKIENTVQTALAVNQENAIPYANFRDFLSTFLIYDNGGQLNAGSDLNYIGMQSANTTKLFEYSPTMLAAQTRKRLMDDVPAGMYYIDHRRRPIRTSAFGNVQLTFLPTSVVSAQSAMLIGYEYFANMNVITNAGSIQN